MPRFKAKVLSLLSTSLLLTISGCVLFCSVAWLLDLSLELTTELPGEGPSVLAVPGNAGKSSLLIVNSLDSDVGCFTMPTETTKWVAF